RLYTSNAPVRARSGVLGPFPRSHERVQSCVHRDENPITFCGPHNRSGDCVNFRSMVSVKILKHARPVRSGPLRDEERAVSQLFIIDARPFRLRNLVRLAAHHLDEGEKMLVTYDSSVREFCEGCDRVDGRVHHELGPQLRSDVARDTRYDSHVRRKIPQPDEIRFTHSTPRTEHRFANARMTDLPW